MRDDDVIALIVMLVIGLVILAVYISLIVLGVTIAKRKNRSPHWMWFAVHPMRLLITLIVRASLPPLGRCPTGGRSSNQQARLCGFCGYDFYAAAGYAPPPPQGAYMPPQRY